MNQPLDLVPGEIIEAAQKIDRFFAERGIKRWRLLNVAEREALERAEDLLRMVQTDPGNWLHSDLEAAIEAVVGAPGPYRSINDPGMSKSTTEVLDTGPEGRT